ncbi:ABC transporter substrate-binding protein [Arthrobacter sp. PGP41]|uniref:ABC transporter substrate-binding protein n=1 Tax=Arthrobacter sp. PGP41 TaxID=2079227 RepID=UPI000CDBD08B|nr:ABC transporter substrate-binding protein [Arthrobacter sp. PGP41]AUZ36416.1 ABC transporter substrate-binding protein [Arthrobacter sp. PGP41]
MSNPIDVGSVLGGRYKVTATVLASHDHDLVLDGVDQVLNRPVSILVAGPGNTEQVAQSAREVATGERPGTVQVLDLGMTEAATYLITNHTSAADLLDLVVASNPPYVEPFFTDTLGSEIFGQPRSHEPEPYDDEDHIEAGYIKYSDTHPSQVDPYRQAPAVPPKPPAKPAASPSSARKSAGASAVGGAATVGGALGGAAGAGSGARNASEAATRATALNTGQARDQQVPTPGNVEGTPGGRPKVSLWSDADYAYAEDQPSGTAPVEDEPQTANKKPSSFARSAAPTAAAAAFDSQGEYDDDRDEAGREPRSMRWLVGGLLAVVLIAGLVFAVTNLGSLFSPQPQAGSPAPATNGGAPETTAPGTQAPSSAAPAAPPAIENISRQGSFDFAATFDGDLVKAYDGNAASYWSDMEFATENWGGLAPQGVPLVVKLKKPAKVSSITLSQLGGAGGNITVYTNDRPALDGAKAVGTNSFTSTDLTMPLAEPVQAQYVIVSINSLPRLAAPKTRYGYGVRLAEIKVQ